MKKQKVVLFGLCVWVVCLVGCSGRETPTITPTALVLATAVPVTLPPATTTPTALPSSTATSEPFPNLPLLAGWEWHVEKYGRYALPYPTDGVIEKGETAGFSWPGTGSQVRLFSWPLAEGHEWLAALEQNKASIPILAYKDKLEANASYGEQPALFVYETGGNGGTMASFFIPTEERIFEIYFQSAVDGLLIEEVGAYLTVVNNFRLGGEDEVEVELPMAWQEGATLAVYFPDSEPAQVTADELRPYREGIEGTVTESDMGQFILVTDDGQIHTFGGRGYKLIELADSVDEFALALEQPLLPALEVGERIRVIGYPMTTDNFRSQFIAVERDGAWQPYGYQTFFDLDREMLDPALLAHYPQDGPLTIWLLGSSETVLPYLVDETGNPWQSDQETVPQILAFGTLINTTTEPRLQVERVYGFSGSCERQGEWSEICYPWQRID
jgi:hypothetical protein